MPPHPRLTLLAAVLLLLSSSGVTAQTVTGTVTDQVTRAPVRGAFVSLLNPRGARVAGALTNERGQFSFSVAAGTYSVRAERIGHRTASSEPFTLAAGQGRRVDLPLEVAALRLKEIDVRGDNRCVSRPEGSRQTAQVWEEARKALTVAAWLETSAAIFHARAWERQLDRNLETVGAPEYRFSNYAGKRAYAAEHPDTLAKYGYIRETAQGRLIYGPDAELLLSNSFLSQHCFRLARRPDRPGLLGLAFEPVRGRRLPDIKGTLWLDERTAALRFIEFTYTGVEFFDDPVFAGGRTDFEQLANGAWVVRRWYVRGPTLARLDAGRSTQIQGAFESGGEILNVRLPGEADAAIVKRAAIEGVVFDSISGRPLEGAQVYLSGTPFRTVAGLAGRFRLDSIPTGAYGITFSHPVLDSVPQYPRPVVVELGESGVSGLRLGTPSAESALRGVCPPEVIRQNREMSGDTTREARGVVFGTIDFGGAIARDAAVVIRWSRFFAQAGRLDNVRVSRHGLNIGVVDGRYIACAVPVDHPIVLELRVRGQFAQRDSLRIPRHGVQRLDWKLKGDR